MPCDGLRYWFLAWTSGETAAENTLAYPEYDGEDLYNA
jgi:hypothetical protein